KVALKLRHSDDPKKNAKDHWFYGDKRWAKKLLTVLDDIKHGRGLLKGGNRYRFRYGRTKVEDED
ncbi:MAG: hypothetical protein KUG81_07360, partial [Gammaproteobacteria bacterium]|nr:hypothetical protein [Gammaproteobacteria bacterium]